MRRTGVDEIAAALLQHLDGFCARAVDLLHDEVDVLGVDARLVHGLLVLGLLKLGDVIVVVVVVRARAAELRDRARAAAALRELLLRRRELVRVLRLLRGSDAGEAS